MGIIERFKSDKDVFGRAYAATEAKEYHCCWCDERFKYYVQAIKASHGDYGRKSNMSTQVVCPNCKQYLKTWE